MRVPKALRPRFDEICALTDRFCAERLDAEYAELCRKLVAKLARKRPSPLERGDPRIWAAAACTPSAASTSSSIASRSST